MGSPNLTNFWKILQEHKFPVDKVDAEYLCKICMNIMINPHSVQCGCTYCRECIEKFLNKDTKCPGQTKDCRDISIESISINHLINSKISNLVVKCPEKLCKFEGKLRDMETHIVNGKFLIINCPYYKIGCNLENVTHDSIEKHLESHQHNHIKLLMDVIDKIEKRIQKLEEYNENLINEIQQIKLQIEQTANKLQTMLNEQIQKIEALKNNDKIVQNNIKALTDKNNEQNQGIAALRDNDEILRNNIKDLKDENNGLRDLIKRLANEIQENMTQKYKKIEEELKSTLEIQEKQNYGEFIWKINNFTNELQNSKNYKPQKISESFYSHKNGYKLCLRLYLNGLQNHKGQSVSIFFNIMKGEYDDILPWPFKYNVTMALINQSTQLPYVSHTVNFNEFPNSEYVKKPHSKMNDKGFGTYQLIQLNELVNTKGLIENDKIFIKCIVDIK